VLPNWLPRSSGVESFTIPQILQRDSPYTNFSRHLFNFRASYAQLVAQYKLCRADGQEHSEHASAVIRCPVFAVEQCVRAQHYGKHQEHGLTESSGQIGFASTGTQQANHTTSPLQPSPALRHECRWSLPASARRRQVELADGGANTNGHCHIGASVATPQTFAKIGNLEQTSSRTIPISTLKLRSSTKINAFRRATLAAPGNEQTPRFAS